MTRGAKGSAFCYDRDKISRRRFAGATVDRVGAATRSSAIGSVCAALDAPIDLIGFIGNAVGSEAVEIVGTQRFMCAPLLKHIEALLVIGRDYDAEYKDGERKYRHLSFDAVLRRYIMRALNPFLPSGRALEMGCYTGDVTDCSCVAVRRCDRNRGVRRRERAAERSCQVRSTEHSSGSSCPTATIRMFSFILSSTWTIRSRCCDASTAGSPTVAFCSSSCRTRTPRRGRGNSPFGMRPPSESNDAVHEQESAGTDIEGPTAWTRSSARRSTRAAAVGGVLFKPLANYQFDKLMGGDVISDDYLEGCYRLGCITRTCARASGLACETG